MKIDRSKLRKTQSDVAPECKQLIQRLKEANDSELIRILQDINTWYYGKCELQHWVDVMDKFDEILASVAKPVNGSSWILAYDKLDQLEGPDIAIERRCLVNHVLRFTALVLEHSYTRHLYSSSEHLVSLLVASDMEVVLSVLGVLYVFSKRSSFIPRLPADKRKAIQHRLQCLGETWGGKNAGFSLAHCCEDLPLKDFPASCGDVYFEYYNDNPNTSQPDSQAQTPGSQLTSVHVKQLYQFSENPGEVMEQLLGCYNVPADKQVNLFSRIRLAKHFPVYEKRLQCIQARLQAISVLLYSNSTQDVVNPLLYQGFIEETVELLEMEQPQFIEIRTAAIRTLTALVHMECSPRVNTVIDCTGLASYHGFLPTLTRNCIQALTDPQADSLPLPFATGLFSFLYHLAYYEIGAEALVSCGLLEALLRVVEHQGGDSHLTFVTRAIRIMEWIANMDLSGYQNQSGLTAIISRLEQEIKKCLPHHGPILSPELPSAPSNQQDGVAMETNDAQGTQSDAPPQPSQTEEVPMETEQPYINSTGATDDNKMEVDEQDLSKEKSQIESAIAGPSSGTSPVSKNRCLPQRAALIKAVLSFLKKSIPDPSFSESIRNVMDSSLPTSLKNVISNVEYYGPVLFMAAIDVVTVYVFHEPSLLSSLQDNGLTAVMLKALVVKEVPATREVLSSLPSVLSALCLNTRGLQAFMSCKPFDKLFRVLLSPDYLPAMRRRRTSESLGETASNLGTAMDELMRHQPTLKTDAMMAIIKLLQEVCSLGKDPKYIGFKMGAKPDGSDTDNSSALGQGTGRVAVVNEEPMSDEEEDDEDRFSFTSTTSAVKVIAENDRIKDNSKNAEEEKRTFIPLIDYILNVVRFVDSILSNNSTDDHCREFVRLGGLDPLINILGLPNLPLDFVTSPACQSVSGVCKSILILSHESQVLKQGLTLLSGVLSSLEPLILRSDKSPVSILLHEVACSGRPQQAMASMQLTPLLHGIAAVHAHISMFLHVCKVGQFEIRTLCINHWGSDEGIAVLKQLGQLHMFLIWETIVLEIASRSDTSPDETKVFDKDLEMLKASTSASLEEPSGQTLEGGPGIAVTNDKPTSGEANTAKSNLLPEQQRIIKQLLQTSTALGRALSDLFVLLVKLCVGSAQRMQRRVPQTAMPTPPACLVALELSRLLKDAMSWRGFPSDMPALKPRLHFYVCVVGSASRLLFDEKKNPYHLMLQQFDKSGAHSSLFSLLKLILKENSNALPSESETETLLVGAQELLDSWLTLVSRLVNSETLLDSPHSLPTTSTALFFVPFKPIEFLVKTQKKAFSAVQQLWGKKFTMEYGPHMAEVLLAILYHIIKGEAVIKEKLGPTPESSSASRSTVASSAAVQQPGEPARPQPEINVRHLQQFIDMGFTHEHARLALMSTGSLEEATDYILTHPPPPPARELGLDYDMLEEDQMMRAIAMSLGQDMTNAVASAEDQSASRGPTAAPVATTAATTATATAAAPSTATADAATTSMQDMKEETKEVKEEDEEKEDSDVAVPLDKMVLDQFTADMLQGCLEVLTGMPGTVFKACDVLSAVAQRNGKEWKERTMMHILKQLTTDIGTVLKSCTNQGADSKQLEEDMSKMSSMSESARLSSLLHLLCLLFEEKKFRCEAMVETHGIVNPLLELLELCQANLVQIKHKSGSIPSTPIWLSPLLLLLDTHEKMAVTTKRKQLHDKCTTHAWKWFDDRSGRWYNYNVNNNTTIDAAYRNGDSRVRFMAGRRRYLVNFSTMVQVNEDSGNRRPIMLETVTNPSNGGSGSGRSEAESSSSSSIAGVPKGSTEAPLTSSQEKGSKKTKKDKQEKSSSDKYKPDKAEEYCMKHLNDDQKALIIRCCTWLISIPVSPNTLHAVLKLCLRLTQEHKFAVQFVEQGGARALLLLTQDSQVAGFGTLATLLIRHILEDKENLKHAMEKVVRSSASSSVGSPVTGVSQSSPGAKEINYVLRVLGPAACRNAGLFKEVATNSLRLAITPQLRRTMIEAGDTNLPVNYAQIVKAAIVAKPSKPPPVAKQVHCVVYDLLNVLCAADNTTRTVENRGILVTRSHSEVLGELGHVLGQVGDMIAGFASVSSQQNLAARQLPAYTRQLTGEDAEVEEMALDSSQNSSQGGSLLKVEEKKEENTKEENKDSNKDVQTKSKPLLSKSAILKLLAELVKSYSGVAQLITDYSHTAKLSSASEYEGPVLAFILDHLLPSGTSSDNEDTPSCARTLLATIATCHLAPEAQQTLIAEMKGSLSRALNLPESTAKHSRLQAIFTLVQTMIENGPHSAAQHTASQQPNNVMKLLLKKGLVNDLARVPHSLDLASPNFVATVNCLLKPMEKLSGVVNQQSTGTAPSAVPKDRVIGGDLQTRSGEGTTAESESRQESSIGQSASGAAEQGAQVTQQSTNSTSEQVAVNEGSLAPEVPRDNGTPSSNSWGLTEISGRSIIPMASEEELEELQDMVDELLHSDSNEGQTGQDMDSSIIAEHVTTRRMADGRVVEETTYVIDPNTSDSDDDDHSSSNGEDSGGEGVADDTDEEEGEEDGGGGDDDETMVITFEEPAGNNDDDDHDNDDVDDDDDDDDDDDEDDEDEDEEEINMGNNTGGGIGAREGGVMEESSGVDVMEEEGEEDDDDHDEDEDEGGSDMDEDGADMIGDDSFRIYEEDAVYLPFDEGSGRHLEFVSGPHGNRFSGTFMMTMSQDDEPETISSMAQRLSRVHGLRVTPRHHTQQSQSVHSSHPQGVTQPPLPAVIQNLLGPETSDGLQFNTSASHRGRHLVQDEIQVIARTTEDGGPDEIFFENFSESAPSSVPSALTRWAEEGQILDTQGVHYCVAAVKPEILPILLKYQAEEIAKGREEEQKKKAEAQAKAAAAKKEEEEKKKQGKKGGEESSTAVEGQSTSVEREAIGAYEPQSEVMQVEQQPADTVTEAEATPSEPTPTEDASMLIRMYMDEPSAEAPVVSTDQAMVRTSTPVSESEEHASSVSPALVPAMPASSVVQDIISAATAEAASLRTAEEAATPAMENHPGSVTEAESTEQEAAQQESDSSPMALEEEGTTTAPSADSTEPSQAIITTPTSEAEAETGPAADAGEAGTSGEAAALTIDGIPIPDGVDPSFLEALPEAIRREVLAEQLGLHPPPASQRNTAASEGNEANTDLNVSPEFLAALPPDVQEEVLQQQRIEQERRRIQTATPEQAVDPGSFLRNLAPSLRQTVLADIDDSLLPLLPTDLASEAQTLRREIEARHHRLLQERFNFGSGDRASAISALLRHSALSRHGGGSHFARLLPTGGGLSSRGTGFSNGPSYLPPPNRKIVGRHLLDHEALVCLLVLLFVEEPRLNTGRLHKVLRNLCYHEETRTWLISAMISILRRTSGQTSDGSCPVPCVESSSHAEVSSSSMSEPIRTESPCRLDEYLLTQEQCSSDSNASKQHSWLSFGVRTSLGSRTNVFAIKRQGKAGLERSTHVGIHPQASQFVCKHVLDALLFLAKSFPASFAPFQSAAKLHPSCSKDDSLSTEGKVAGTASQDSTDFWDILLKLDTAGSGRKGKSAAKASASQSSLSSTKDSPLEEFSLSPIGQLLGALDEPVVQGSVVVTDKLLRLLSVTSAALPDLPVKSSRKTEGCETAASEAVPAETAMQAPTGEPVTQSMISTEAVTNVTVTIPEESVTPHHVTVDTPCSETESVASSLIVERSSEAGGEPHEVESLDGGSVDEPLSHPSETSSHPGVVEPMIVEVTPPLGPHAPASNEESSLLTTSTPAVEVESEGKEIPDQKTSIVKEGELRLVVNVLTSGMCSEEGLEDATTLLLQVSRLNSQTRDSVLQLLLEGARRIGQTLQENIAVLLSELVEHNRNAPQKDESDLKKGKRPASLVLPTAPRRPTRGGHQSGWATMPAGSRARQQNRQVRYDLHLPSMPALTCKTSSQALLLRVLKVILQLREAARKTASGTTSARTRSTQRRVADESSVVQRLVQGSRGLGAVIAAIENEAEAIFEAFSHMRALRSEHHGDQARAGGPRNEPAPQGGRSQDGNRPDRSGQEGEGSSTSGVTNEPELPLLSEQITLEELWETLGECLAELGRTSDSHAVLVLQPAVEAFFLVHGTEKQEKTSTQSQSEQPRSGQRLSSLSSEVMPASPGPLSPGPLSPNRQMSVTSVTSDLPSDTQKFLRFAEKHRTVLNQILRQSTIHLADGPFAVLVDHTRVLDFDVKRRFFRQELERLDEGMRRDDLTIHVRREHVFEDSYRELHRRSAEEMKSRLYVVFEGEEGQDAGGLLREWFVIMSREMFNPNYALFTTSPGDKVTYQPNASSNCNSNHLSYFKFVGRIVAKAIYDNKLLDCFFTRSFYKHILDKPVHFTDLESFDYALYQGLHYLLEHDISDIDMELTFSTEVHEFGLSEVRELVKNGKNIAVTEENKKEYVQRVCQMKMTGAIRNQLDSFLEGFYDIIPKRLISIFDEQELELLISGLPNIDLDDLKANTEYHKYTENSLQIQWFWRALRSFDQADRAKFLQFVTGTSKVPLQGFGALEGMNGFQKFQIHRDDRSTDRLPSAHTCFNQLDLPAYETYDKLRSMLNKAVDECPEGFGLA